ncbi:MAG: ABC transporter substrate-binding protein [Clostridiaceae bacterium]|jgi:hypothetical protein|nr:ABC transporter substrate-binding protein [Clostridiaceae bacterium]
MKERIYTIPITEAFDQDSECPLCICEKKLESDALEYTLGPSMMEPDSRIETNRMGFCALHFTKLYNMQQTRLGLGLVIETHLAEQKAVIEKMYRKYSDLIQQESQKNFLERAAGRLSGKAAGTARFSEEMLSHLDALEKSCAICSRVGNNMDRFIGTILHLFFKERDFRQKFESSKGFCLKHMKALIRGSKNQLGQGKQAEFIRTLLPLQIRHLKRIQEEVTHFTEMFDYKNQDGDWKNSRDAVPRSIEKICGPCDLQK